MTKPQLSPNPRNVQLDFFRSLALLIIFVNHIPFNEAQVVLGAAVIDDILGVILLAVLYEFSLAGKVDPGNAGKVMGFIAVFFVLASLFAKVISLAIRQFALVSRTDGLIPTLIVSLVLFFAWLAHAMGAPNSWAASPRDSPCPGAFSCLSAWLCATTRISPGASNPDAAHHPDSSCPSFSSWWAFL